MSAEEKKTQMIIANNDTMKHIKNNINDDDNSRKLWTSTAITLEDIDLVNNRYMVQIKMDIFWKDNETIQKYYKSEIFNSPAGSDRNSFKAYLLNPESKYWCPFDPKCENDELRFLNLYSSSQQEIRFSIHGFRKGKYDINTINS
eukprot:262275_1